MTISDVDLNKLTQLGVPRSVRRDALIALNLNGVYSARKASNARARCAVYWTTLGLDDPLAHTCEPDNEPGQPHRATRR